MALNKMSLNTTYTTSGSIYLEVDAATEVEKELIKCYDKVLAELDELAKVVKNCQNATSGQYKEPFTDLAKDVAARKKYCGTKKSGLKTLFEKDVLNFAVSEMKDEIAKLKEELAAFKKSTEASQADVTQ